MWAWSCLTEARERQRDRSVEIAAAAKAVVLVEAAECIAEGGVAVDESTKVRTQLWSELCEGNSISIVLWNEVASGRTTGGQKCFCEKTSTTASHRNVHSSPARPRKRAHRNVQSSSGDDIIGRPNNVACCMKCLFMKKMCNKYATELLSLWSFFENLLTFMKLLTATSILYSLQSQIKIRFS
jgi:hypothetical protein